MVNQDDPLLKRLRELSKTNPNLIRAANLVCGLHLLEERGQGESADAEKLREQGADLWELLTQKERDKVLKLSKELENIRKKEVESTKRGVFSTFFKRLFSGKKGSKTGEKE